MVGQKKRKASRNTEAGLTAQKGGTTKLTINSWEDVADSGDEFQISRDKILLEEEPARKRQRKLDEEYDDLLPSDEEVLELPDSEVDDYSDEDDEQDDIDDDVKSTEGKDAEEELEEGWGTSRKDYYNADTIETEADALEEEEEALRLQQKQLQGMTEADFGLDEVSWLPGEQDVNEDDETGDQILRETLPQIEITGDMPLQERTRLLTSRYPEFEALAREFIALEEQYAELSLKAEAIAKDTIDDGPIASTPGSVLKWRALGAYLGVLSMYFVLLTSGQVDAEGHRTAMNPVEMRRHPLMETLMQARSQWKKINVLSLPDPEIVGEKNVFEAFKTLETAQMITNGHVDQDKKFRRRRKGAKSKTKTPVNGVRSDEAERVARIKKTKDDIAQLTASLSQKSITKTKIPVISPTQDNSDFGEVNPGLTSKDRKKKSLAFYTSQIAGKTQKRNLASRGAGGDEDIPHKERFRDKVARLNAEAEARGQRGKDALDGGSDDEDARVAAEVRDQGEDEDYYQTIASKTKSKKENKAARAAALQEAAAQGAQIREIEQIGSDGKRAITYAIEKNKGLTPKRKKEARNPRVKKRLKYEDKMKKLGSIRQLYKGGEGRGGYGGELTGIKSSIVRSRKL